MENKSERMKRHISSWINVDYKSWIDTFLDQNTRMAFIVSFISGIICHLYVFCNHYPTYGGLHSFIDRGNRELQEGRWFASLLVRSDGYVTLPVVNGLESVCFLALAVVFVIKTLRIYKKEFIVLVGILFECFPVVASRYTYLYMANVFSMATLLACFGVFLWSKEKIRFDLCAILCFALSAAAYQADISIALVMISLLVFLDVITNENIEKIIRGIIRAIIDVSGGLLIWLLIFKICIYLGKYDLYTHIPGLAEYDILYRIRKCYGASHWFLFSGSCLNSRWGKVCVYSTLIEIGLMVFILARTCWKLYGRSLIARLLLISIIVLALPIFANYVFFIDPQQSRLYRLFASYVVFFITPMCLYCRFEKQQIVWSWLANFICIICILLSWNCFVTDNTAYMNASMTFKKEYSLALRIVDRIESFPGYKPGMPVMIISDEEYVYDGDVLDSELDEFISNMSQTGNFFVYDFSGIIRFVDQFIQTNMYFEWHPVDDNIMKKLDEWPSNNCIIIEDGRVYLRLS